MRYYVVADVHGFYTELIQALEMQGFFEDKGPRKLIVCGDLFDRGAEALKLQTFILELMAREEVLLIRGNHEDLMLSLLAEWRKGSYYANHHLSNKTVDTVLQLTGRTKKDLFEAPEEVGRELLSSPFVQTIIPAMRDYFETKNYIFVHGWIPCQMTWVAPRVCTFSPIWDWRQADVLAWENARWTNGMQAAHEGITEVGKIIVCGHWHCSFGHARYEGIGGEFENDPIFTPYYGRGIIAIDGCTAFTRQVNCIVIEDEEL